MNYSKSIVLGWRQCQIWLLSLACVLFSVQAMAADVAANVSFVSGLVTATSRSTATRELAKGSDVFSGDSIDTLDNGRIQMRFTDGGLVSLMPGTTFSVDEYLYPGKTAEDGSLVFGMLRGGLRTITGSIGKIKHENYELKTPVATLGIRGTEYVAVLNPANTLRVHVGKGKVVITNDQGTLEVPEGRNAVVSLGHAPELTEQGPLYSASAIGGDKLTMEGLSGQDPLWPDLTPQSVIPSAGGIPGNVAPIVPPSGGNNTNPPSSGGTVP